MIESRDQQTIDLALELIRRRSVTPADGGCQELLGGLLEEAGFSVEHMPFGKVSNLWARHGGDSPVLCFAGHTDVVPPGPRKDWEHDPFEPELSDGWLKGRGAADMKTGIAAMVRAGIDFANDHPELLRKFMEVTDQANAAYNADSAPFVETISTAAGMDLAATQDMLGMFSFPSAADQKSEAWMGGTVQSFTKEVADFFVEQGQLEKALDSYDFAIDDSYL
jgi:hypothetical protein